MVLENIARLMGVILLGDISCVGTHPYSASPPGRLMNQDERSLACTSGGPHLNSALSAAFCLASAFFSGGAGNCLLIKQDILDFLLLVNKILPSLSLPTSISQYYLQPLFQHFISTQHHSKPWITRAIRTHMGLSFNVSYSSGLCIVIFPH